MMENYTLEEANKVVELQESVYENTLRLTYKYLPEFISKEKDTPGDVYRLKILKLEDIEEYEDGIAWLTKLSNLIAWAKIKGTLERDILKIEKKAGLSYNELEVFATAYISYVESKMED